MTEPLLTLSTAQGTFALTREPLRCAECGEMHSFFVNRDGKTRCSTCDQRYREGE